MSTTRLVFGLALVLVGVMFLLSLADVVSAGEMISAGWPVVLIGFGVVHYLNSRQVVGSAVVIGLGAVLLLFSLDVLPGSATAMVGPLLLILVGVWILLGRGRISGASAGDTVSSFSMFGEANLTRHSQAFAGGQLVEIFGDTNLDLRPATIAPEGAHIDILALFADVKIIVPAGWRIELTGIPVFGEYSDRTNEGRALPSDAPTLTVNTLAVFAEVKVEN